LKRIRSPGITSSSLASDLDRNGRQDQRLSVPPTKSPTPSKDHDDDDNPLVDFSSRKKQLWLDLRDAAFFPHEAVRFLKEQCADEQQPFDETVLRLIDGVLVSQDMFERIALQESQILGKQSYVLLYETDDTKEVVANSASAQMSIPVGKIVVYDDKPNSTLDPMDSLDVVIDQKKWLLLDPKHRLDTEESAGLMKNQVASLLQFVAASSMSLPSNAGEQFTSVSGLILPGLTSPETSSSTGSKTGGVAIVCPDQSSYLQMDSLLAEYRSSAQTTTTTESGLLVPSEMVTSSDDEARAVASLPSTALILPLDLKLWKTALLLMHMEDEAGDVDIDDLLQP